MSAFIKINPRMDRYLNLAPLSGVEIVPNATMMGLSVKGGKVVQPAKKNKTKDEPQTDVTPGIVTIEYGIIEPFRYDVMLAPHHDLYKLGIVSCPVLVPAGSKTHVALRIIPFAALDGLKDLPWELTFLLTE